MPTGVMILLPTEPTLDEMIEAGGEIVEHAESHSICIAYGAKTQPTLKRQ